MIQRTEQALLDTVRAFSSPYHDTHAIARLLRAAGLLIAIFIGGTIGYYILGDGEFDLLTCAYMTLITLTTIGYGEVLPIIGHTDRILFTIVLVFMGMGTVLYFFSQLTAFIVDGELTDLFFHRSMRRAINKLDKHFIVAGVGSTGRHVLDEMIKSGKPCLVIEANPKQIEAAEAELDAQFGHRIPYVIGDATDDITLQEAGIERALGIVFALGNDRDNLFATITARSLNKDIRIVTRGQNKQSKAKFERAGATEIIYTNVLGGMRMAAEVIRPEVTGFLDLMMKDHDEVRRIEELEVPPDSPLVGKRLREIGLRQHVDALIIAMVDKASPGDKKNQNARFNPGPDCIIEANSKLILLLRVQDIPTIEALLCGKPLPKKGLLSVLKG